MKISDSNIIRVYTIFIRDFFKDLFDDRLGYYASSLSWSTLFSIIPMLVILLAVFTSLPVFNTFYDQLHDLLLDNLMPTNSEEIMTYIDSFVANSGKMGIMGVAYVLIAAIMFFKSYDFVVNDIFETEKRTILEALRTYVLLIIIVPVMLGTSFYLSFVVQTYLVQNEITSIARLFFLFPFFIIWGVFFISYQLSAHKKISTKATVISSFIASLIWYLAKSGFLFYVTSNKTYASVYGSISILLFFFLWIYVSWAIFLHGLRLCYLLDKEEEIDQI